MDKNGQYSNWNPRIPVFYAVFAAAFLFLLGTLAYRQIYLYDYYSQRGERQSMRRIIEPGARGDIYDRNMKLLVTNEPRFSAVVYFNEIRREFRREYMRLKKIELARRAAAGEDGPPNYSEISSRARANVLNGYVAQINSILGSNYKLTTADYNRHFENQRLLPFPIIKDLKGREHAILAERLPVDSPIQIYTDTARYYPYGPSAAHLLGYVGSNFDEIDTDGVPGDDLRTFSFVGKIGRSGLEKAFDSVLQGSSGAKIWVVDLDGYQYENVADVTPKKGRSVVSSIDIDLQQTIEDSFGTRKGAAVALDVKTGEVLAMVSLPSYDPNELSPYMTYKVSNEITKRGAWLNRATQGLYPPGSTFKIVTACAGLMTGVIDEKTVKTCDGGLRVGTRIFPCNSRSGHGNIDLVDALAHSCNVYFYETALECGIEALSATAKDFGLDSKSGIELKEDYSRRSVVADPEYKEKYRPYDGPWTAGDTANTSIGQGYQLQTPLQMACMVASFARGQTRTRPSVIHDTSRVCDLAYHGGEKLNLKPEHYKAIIDGMKAAVERGTAKRAAVEGVSVAAKSGTAQVPVRGKKLTLAWMVAFAPVENPQVAISVVVEGEEIGDASGGRTAGPIVGTALKKYFETSPLFPKVGNAENAAD